MNKRHEQEVERVRRHTPPDKLETIDQRIEHNVRIHGARSKSQIANRISDLDTEWSIERYLDTNASVFALTGAVLGITTNRKWFLLSAAVSGFLLQHALTGWCPPVPFLRRLGVRTRSEIDREKFALKALRGDFKNVDFPERRVQQTAAKNALQAAAT